MADFRKIGKGITGALTKASEIAKSNRVTGDQAAADAIGKAAESAGMNKPVTANKDLTTMQDFYTSFGDSVRKRAMDMQATMDSLDYKYDKGHRVFTEDSARKNWPPMTVLGRVLEGNRIMREDPTDFLSKKIIDPETGKAMRTPHEAGYKVRLEHAPDNWSEFVIPESAIKGSVSEARGGFIRKARGGIAMARGGLRMASGGTSGIKPYQYDAKAGRQVFDVPGVGPVEMFVDEANKRIVVSDEGYWNPKSPTGEALAKAVQWAHDQGYQAGVAVTPYSSERLGGDNVAGITRPMQGATDDQLRAYIDAADFVVTDPYIVNTSTATKEMRDNLANFTKNVGNYAESTGKDAWLYLQGFSAPDVDPKLVEDFNRQLIDTNKGTYDNVSFFNVSDFRADEDTTGIQQLDTQSFYDALNNTPETKPESGFEEVQQVEKIDKPEKSVLEQEYRQTRDPMMMAKMANFEEATTPPPLPVIENPLTPPAPPMVAEPPPPPQYSGGYTYATQDGGIGLDKYYENINNYLSQHSDPNDIAGAMQEYGVSQEDIDTARGYQPQAQYAFGGKVRHMAKAGRVGDIVEGGLSVINKAKEIAKARKAAAEGSKIEEVLASQTPPMTRPQGTGLPLMPRDNGMYTLRDQKDLPRMVMVDKARAENKSPKYNERMQDLLDSPKARKKVDNLINKGKELNVQEWYGTEPLRQVALDAGRTPEQFESLMAQLASASQRNPVDKQNQMGSYLYHLSETGQLPENSLLLTNKLKKALKEDPSLAEGRQLVELPTGYGSLAQGDIFNRAVMIGQGKIGEALPPNKKLGTFYENLLGNLKPVTVDVNALRGPIIEQGDPRWLTSKLVEKDDKGKIINSYKPREMYNSGEMSMREAQQRPGFWEAAPSGSEYAGFEDLWQRGAKRHGVEPAEAQALGWYGSADVTALKTKPENYVDNLERLIKRTAEQTGQSPTKVMNDLVTGEGFLRKDGGKVEEPHWHKVFNRKMKEGGYAWVDQKHVPKVRSLKHLAKGGSSDEPTTREIMEAMPQVIKEATSEEAESYKKPRAISDVLYRGLVANNPISVGVDMANLGLMGVDAVTGMMGKPTRLASEKPFAGSEHVKDLMKKYGVTTDEERPISETLLGIMSPTAAVKGVMNAPKMIQKAGEAVKGGLNALPKNLPVGMSIEMVGDMTPKEQALAKMREMRPEMKASSDLQKKYDAEMDSKYTRDMPTFEQWKAKQNAKKAHGGLTLMR